jgi:hypothetical protein
MDYQSCFAMDAPVEQEVAMRERDAAAGRCLDDFDASCSRSI